MKAGDIIRPSAKGLEWYRTSGAHDNIDEHSLAVVMFDNSVLTVTYKLLDMSDGCEQHYAQPDLWELVDEI